MQDADAHLAVGVDVGVEDGRLELHLGRHERVLRREGEARAEEAAAVRGRVVGEHEHHLPLEDVVVVQAHADARDGVLVGLHLLELPREKAGGGGGGRCHGGWSVGKSHVSRGGLWWWGGRFEEEVEV